MVAFVLTNTVGSALLLVLVINYHSPKIPVEKTVTVVSLFLFTIVESPVIQQSLALGHNGDLLLCGQIA